jgi:hypothetical protein
MGHECELINFEECPTSSLSELWEQQIKSVHAFSSHVVPHAVFSGHK